MKSKKQRLKTLEEIQQLRNNLSGLLGNNKSIDPKGNYVSFEVRDNNHLLTQIISLLEVCVFALDGDGMMLFPANQNASKEDSVIQASCPIPNCTSLTNWMKNFRNWITKK